MKGGLVSRRIDDTPVYVEDVVRITGAVLQEDAEFSEPEDAESSGSEGAESMQSKGADLNDMSMIR